MVPRRERSKFKGSLAGGQTLGGVVLLGTIVDPSRPDPLAPGSEAPPQGVRGGRAGVGRFCTRVPDRKRGCCWSAGVPAAMITLSL